MLSLTSTHDRGVNLKEDIPPRWSEPGLVVDLKLHRLEPQRCHSIVPDEGLAFRDHTGEFVGRAD